MTETRSARRRWRALGLLAALALAAGGAWPSRAVAAPARPRVLVLPFADAHHIGRIYWLTEAAAVLLTDDLNRLGLQAVTREDRRRAFDRLQIPTDVQITDATAIRIARLVGATQVVLGGLSLETGPGGDQLVARIRRIRLAAGRMDPTVVERAPLREIFPLFGRLARRLVPQASLTVQQLADRHPPLVAFEDYVKGLLAENPETQIRYLRSSMALDPSLDRAHLALWRVFSEQGNDEAALAAVNAVPAASPEAARARFRAALSLIHLKRWDEASTALKQLVAAHPTAAVFNDLGVVELRRGGADASRRAADDFAKATQADPDAADYFFNLGYSYWLQHNARAAIYWLREAVRRNPTDGAAHFVLGVALAASGDSLEADRERALARQLSSRYAAAGMDRVPAGLERLATALDGPLGVEDVIVESEQRNQKSLAAFYLARARRLTRQQDDRAATAALKRCLFLSPYDAAAQLLLGRIDLREKRTQQAIDVLKISLWSRETAAAHLALAEAYLQAADPKAARAEAARALALNPGADEARHILQQTAPAGSAAARVGGARAEAAVPHGR